MKDINRNIAIYYIDKQTHQDYHYSNDNERNEISNMNNNEIMSYIKLLLESNNEIKEVNIYILIYVLICIIFVLLTY